MRYYGQFQLDKELHERFFQNKQGGFFVECGAFDGEAESTCKFFEESLNWTGLNIEALPHAFAQLVKNRPNCINENFALSNVSEKKIFKNAIHPALGRKFGNGSLSHTEKHMDELIKMGCSFETFEVECVKFSDLYHKHNFPQIDLFVLDVEGHELPALEGILTLPEHILPTVFCIENSISDFDKMKALLAQYNYCIQLHHNAVFVRKS